MDQRTPTIDQLSELEETTFKTPQTPEKDRFAATYRLKVIGLAIDNIVIAFAGQQNNIGIFATDGATVIGKLTDQTDKRYDEHVSYRSEGLLARIVSGPLIGQKKGLYIQYYSDADKERQKYVHRRLLSKDLLDPNPVD